MHFFSIRPLLRGIARTPHAIISGMGWPVRVVFSRGGSRRSERSTAYAWQDILPEESQALPEAPTELQSQEPQEAHEIQHNQPVQLEESSEQAIEEIEKDALPSDGSRGLFSGIRHGLGRAVRFVMRRKEPLSSSAYSWYDIPEDRLEEVLIKDGYEEASEGSPRRRPFSGLWSSTISGLARMVRFVLRRKEPSHSSAYAWQDILPDGTVRRKPEREEGITGSRWSAISRITHSAKRKWKRLVWFILRREAPLEDEEDLWEEGYFDVDAQWSSLTTPPKSERWWSPKNLVRAVNNIVRHRTMTITVEDGVVRVVVFQGKEAIAWGTAHPEEDFTSSGLDMGALADGYEYRLYALLKELEFGRIRLITELPLYTPLMRQIQLPPMKRGYFDPIVAAELQDTIPFSGDEVDFKWQHRKNEAGHEIFAAAIPRRVIDSHVRTLKKGNVRPSATYSRAIALAFATGIPDVIVAHLAPSEAAIVLARDGVPKVIHRVDLSNWEESPDQRAEDIARAVEQVSSYITAPDTQDDGIPQIPVVLTGQLASESSLSEPLTRVIQREILDFGPPLVYPEYFPPAEYAANIGLALADRSRGRTGEKLSKKKAPSVNLLSERHLPKPFPIRPVAVFVSLVLFGIVAVNAAEQVDSMVQNTATLSNRVENLERQARLHRLSIGRARALEQRIESINQFATALDSQLKEFEVEVDSLLVKMEAITQDALPPDVRVISLALSGDEFALSGKASSYDDVIQFTSNLRKIEPPLFSVVKILRLSSTDGAELVDEDSEDRKGSVGFQVVATIYSSPTTDDELVEKETNRAGDPT